MNRRAILGGVLLGALLGLAATHSEAVTLNPVDTGIFSRGGDGFGGSTLNHNAAATALDVSDFQCIRRCSTRAGFAIYDLSSIAGTVTDVTIDLSLTTATFQLSSPPVSFFVKQVTTAASAFGQSYSESRSLADAVNNVPLGPGYLILEDLLDGPTFASASFDGVGASTVPFDAAGVAEVQQALGGFLVVGIPETNRFGSFQLAAPALNVTLAPEPAATLLLGAGLLGVWGARRGRAA